MLHKNYPKLKLLENAVLTLEPSQSLITSFQEIIYLIKSEGRITEDEAVILQMGSYAKRQLMQLTRGA